MKKLGIGRKDKSNDNDDEAQRSRLFGKAKSKNNATPPSSNPYAVPQSQARSDPYAKSESSNPYAVPQNQTTADPYSKADLYNQACRPSPNHSGLGTSSSRTDLRSTSPAPPAYEGSGSYGGVANDLARADKSPVPSGGYGSGRYGDSGGYGNLGYGSDRFGAGSSTGNTSNNHLAPGGYGGMGRMKSTESLSTTAGGEALFGGARERMQHKQQDTNLPPEEDPAVGGTYGTSNSYGASALGEGGQGYGEYAERQLTAEEQEEQDVQATKDQIRFIKQQDVSSTRNALRIAAQAEETGRETLARLGAQGERIHNTEKNLDLASSQNRMAEEKARELKHLNRSMFAVQVKNPFTKANREREREEAIIEKHLHEKETREQTRKAAYSSMTRQQETGRNLRGQPLNIKKGNPAERSKYQFEADSDDERMEDEIDQNLDALSGAAGRLNMLSRAMGEEVDSQNKHISRIANKADDVDIQLTMNRARLDRIR